MIRRETTDPSLGPCWLLISQVEHARLAHELARHWTRPLVIWPEVNAELLGTIEHHDDGWTDWERAPRVDPATGRPLQFIEMPLDQALIIWQRSIDVCAAIGPLAGWLVAGHFSALLRHSNAWQRTDHPQSAVAAEFLSRQDRMRIQAFRTWQHLDPRRNALAVAEQCLRWLQFFDAFSLWLCCAERRSDDRLTGVDPAEMTLRPQSDGSIHVSPWPFRVAKISLTIAHGQLTQGSYSSDELFAIDIRSKRLQISLVA